MNCAWKDMLAILPPRWRGDVDRLGRNTGQNLRLRLGMAPELDCRERCHWLDGRVTQDDLNQIINTASSYSPWASQTVRSGYITAPGGHRIGICGEAVVNRGEVSGIRHITSLCIRIARDIPGAAKGLAALQGSVLILGAPGWGKTTLLRDLIRTKSDGDTHICVVDQRKELFPEGIPKGRCTEVLSGCPKEQGLDMLIRTMGPEIIALDEITAEEDCRALERAAWCGVTIFATAHAASSADLLRRNVYEPLVRSRLFDNFVVLHQDQSYHVERSIGWDTKGSERC